MYWPDELSSFPSFGGEHEDQQQDEKDGQYGENDSVDDLFHVEHDDFCSGTHKKASCTIMAVFLFSIMYAGERENIPGFCVTNRPSSCRMERV